MACTSTFGFTAATAAMSADDVRRAAHVVLHVAHARRGLDADAAAVERDALADEDELSLGALRGVRDVHEARLVRAAAADRVDELHAAPADLLEVEDLRSCRPFSFATLLGGGGERLRVDDVGRLVAEIAREVHRGADPLARASGPPSRSASVSPAGADDDAGERALRLAVARQVLGEAIGAELDPLGHGAQLALEPGGQGRARASSPSRRWPREPPWPRRCGPRARRPIASRPGRCRTSFSACEAAEGGEGQRLIALARELLLGDELGQRAAERGVERLERGRQAPALAAALQDADDEDVGGELERPAPYEPGFRGA